VSEPVSFTATRSELEAAQSWSPEDIMAARIASQACEWFMNRRERTGNTRLYEVLKASAVRVDFVRPRKESKHEYYYGVEITEKVTEPEPGTRRYDWDSLVVGKERFEYPREETDLVLLGFISQNLRLPHRCYTREDRALEYYISGYITEKHWEQMDSEAKELYYPFGPWFRLSPWETPSGTAIDHEDALAGNPYRRIALQVSYLKEG
jgi:hypothetical protein